MKVIAVRGTARANFDQGARSTVRPSPLSAAQALALSKLPFREARKAFERMYFEQLLARGSGQLARLAETSGLNRTHLYRKLKELGILTRRMGDSWQDRFPRDSKRARSGRAIGWLNADRSTGGGQSRT